MKALLQAFLALPDAQAIGLIVGAVAIVTIVALIVSRISFNAGVRYADELITGEIRKRTRAERHL